MPAVTHLTVGEPPVPGSDASEAASAVPPCFGIGVTIVEQVILVFCTCMDDTCPKNPPL